MVTGRKVISFVSIFGSHFLSHQKTQRNYHKIDQNGARKSLHVQVRVAIFVTMVTMQYFAFYLICTWAVVQTTDGQTKRKFRIIIKISSRFQRQHLNNNNRMCVCVFVCV